MADAIISNTQAAATKNDLITALVQAELIQEAKLMSTVMDVSKFAIKGAKSISFPKLNGFSVVDRASGAQGDATVLTASADKLDLDIAAYVAYIIDSQDAVQSTLEWELECAKRAASAHGLFVDTKIIAALESSGSAITTVSASLTKAVVIEMREKFVKAQGKLNACNLLISPEGESQLLLIDDFVKSDSYGSSNIPNGVIGKLYGMPVMVHTGLSATQYFLYGKDGMAVGFQQGAKMSSQGANEFGSGATRTAIDQLFGVKGMQLAAGVSALVIKDNNV